MFHSPKFMPDPGKKHRLVTRSDMDELVRALLLKELGVCDKIKFTHPKDMQDSTIEIGPRDISPNLPYVPGVFLAFDHHESEAERVLGGPRNHVMVVNPKSAARVVYDYFGGGDAFPRVSEEMMEAVEKADAARFNRDEVVNAKGWELLSFLMDSRTGLGHFRDFRVSNYELMMQLIDHCKERQKIEEILTLPDVKERVDVYEQHEEMFRDQSIRCSTVHNYLVVLDLRDEEVILAGNRSMVYALFPDCNISIHVIWGRQKQNTVFATGNSIFDRSSQTDIGQLMLSYSGGGHNAADTCQIENDAAEETLKEFIQKITSDE